MPKRPLRADAMRNRERVLEIAAQVFATEGIAVPIDDIARRAGVGIGTVYRHFPTKEALVAAIVHDKMARLVERVASAAAEPDAGAAFFGVLDHMLANSAHKKDLVDALAGTQIELRADGAATELKAKLHKVLGGLVRRAQAAGAVRAGITADDVLALLSATLVAAKRSGSSPARLFAVLRDGLRATLPR